MKNRRQSQIHFFSFRGGTFRSNLVPVQVWLRTEEYLKDALGSVVIDVEDMAINILMFVDAQVSYLTPVGKKLTPNLGSDHGDSTATLCHCRCIMASQPSSAGARLVYAPTFSLFL